MATSARSGDNNKAGLTKKVGGAIVLLEVGEIAWQPLDMARVEARRTSIIFSAAAAQDPSLAINAK